MEFGLKQITHVFVSLQSVLPMSGTVYPNLSILDL